MDRAVGHAMRWPLLLCWRSPLAGRGKRRSPVRRGCGYGLMPAVAEITGGRRWWIVSTILRVSIPWRWIDVIPRWACPSCRWMIGSGIPSVRHLDCVRMSELVRREPAARPCLGREPAQLAAGGGRRPAAAAGWPGQDAEQRTDRQLHAVLGPTSDVLPPPIVHADHPSLAALADANQHGPGLRVQIGLGQRERFADP